MAVAACFSRVWPCYTRLMPAAALRFAKTTWLAATVAVLLPALAWLQYDWVNQLATADRDRREHTLRGAAAQFTSAVDGELSRVGASLQLDGAMVERHDWDAYAIRYEGAMANAATASLVKQVWLIEALGRAATHDARLVAHQWTPDRHSFDAVEWPLDLTALRAQLQTFVEASDDGATGHGQEQGAAHPMHLAVETTGHWHHAVCHRPQRDVSTSGLWHSQRTARLGYLHQPLHWRQIARRRPGHRRVGSGESAHLAGEVTTSPRATDLRLREVSSQHEPLRDRASTRRWKTACRVR